MSSNNNDFIGWMDDFGLIKSGKGDKDTYRMYGFASSPAKDYDQEQVIQKGLNIQPLISGGWVNWDHDRLKTIGHVQLADFRNHPSRSDMAKGLYTEYGLHKGDPIADRVWTMAKAIELNKVPRNFGLSLEGTRRQVDGSMVLAADVYGLALTPYPKNNETTAHVFMKSIMVGIGDVVAADPNIDPVVDWVGAVSDRIIKALTSGYDVGGITQAGGAAIRSEDMAGAGIVRIDEASIPADLSIYSEYDRDLIKGLAAKAARNSWALPIAEAAILMHTVKGYPVKKLLKALEFNTAL